MSGSTEKIAEFVVSIESVPDDLTAMAKRHIADTIACILSGARAASTQIVAGLSSLRPRRSGKAVLPVPGLGFVADAPMAALLTGVAAHADDYDDTSEFGMRGHPSAPVISALLPTVHQTSASGDDLIRAYVVGVEVACKLGAILGETHPLRGWHTISTIGSLAAAAASAKARRLRSEEVARAIGIAGSLAGGLGAGSGTMVKGLHSGHAAWIGFSAAALSEKGFDARLDVVEHQRGFLAAFGGLSEPIATESLDRLGAPWELLDPGVSLKSYPSCSCTHLAVDAALELVSTGEIPVARIQRARCWVRFECSKYLRYHRPETPLQAKFSMEYCVAAALVRHRLAPPDFMEEALVDPAVNALLPKIELLVRADACSEPDLEIELQDGRRLQRRYAGPKGSLVNPLGWTEIEQKFRQCADGTLHSATVDELITRIRNLERVANVQPILARMATPDRAIDGRCKPVA